MPTFRHGRNTGFAVQDSGGTLQDISNVLREVNFPRQADTAETTAFGSAVKTYVVGIIGATFSVSGMYDATVDGYLNGIYGFATSRTFAYGPEGTSNGLVRYTGACFLTSYQTTGSVSDMVGFTADFQISGAITKGTVGTWPN